LLRFPTHIPTPIIVATGIIRSNLKVLLSIGGWSYRDNFVPLGKDAGKREMFAKSGVRLVEDLGLDG
jgi:GH18 family chitinase